MKIKLNFKKKLNEWAKSNKRQVSYDWKVIKMFDVDNNGTLVKYNGNNNFVNVPSYVTKIGVKAFKDANNLIKINIPNSVTKIEEGAFWSCVHLKEITIPDTINEIYPETFFNCVNLEKITFSNSIKYIDKDAFLYCKNLEDIYFKGTEKEWEDWWYNVIVAQIVDWETGQILANANVHYI